MDAGKNVSRCICPVNKTHQFDENIVPVKFQRTEQMSVRVNGGNDEKQCHSCINKRNVAEKLFSVM